MAINKNHLFEDLNGVKCAIVETGASSSRVEFLKDLLTFNGFEVVVISSPPAKGTPAADTEVESLPETFTVGVTDVTFNPTNAIFGRLLRTRNGKVVTLAYWQQLEEQSNDEIPYFDSRT